MVQYVFLTPICWIDIYSPFGQVAPCGLKKIVFLVLSLQFYPYISIQEQQEQDNLIVMVNH